MFTVALFLRIQLGAIQISINRKMDKHVVVFSYNEILFSNKKENTAELSNSANASQNIIFAILDIRKQTQKITFCTILFPWKSRNYSMVARSQG